MQAMTQAFTPVEASERYETLDLIRGVALFGVLMVNLLYFFRISLFARVVQFHSDPGIWNLAIDLLVSGVLEFKAFDLFSLTFGVGVAIQAERGKSRNARVEIFLLRRLLILLVVGAAHMILISNVDILTLYALCGLVMIPLLRLPTVVLFCLGLAGVYAPALISPAFPTMDALREHAFQATWTYSHSAFGAILAFRWRETQMLLVPLLVMTAQKTLGMMLIGAAVWRAGVIRNRNQHRRLLLIVCVVAGVIGIVATSAEVWSRSGAVKTPPVLEVFGSHVPLAFAYGAALLLWNPGRRAATIAAPIAAAGRMALTNYLSQSLIFAVLFYGYGFGLFGKLDPLSASLIGLVVYAGQLCFSTWWLARYRFGPFEWLWRSASYMSWQPMRRG